MELSKELVTNLTRSGLDEAVVMRGMRRREAWRLCAKASCVPCRSSEGAPE